MSVKKRIVSFLLVLLVVLAIGGELLLSLFAVKADALDRDASDVLLDLKQDSSFNTDDYPVIEGSVELRVIQLAETDEGEILVYVYQPNQNPGKYKASSINISATTDGTLNVKNYYLELLDYDGVFQKYLVKDLKSLSGTKRSYEVVSIYRLYNKSADAAIAPSNGNSLSEVVYEVAKEYTFTDTPEGYTIDVKDIETIKITDMFVGFLRYPAGFGFWSDKEYQVDSHFVAFSTNYHMDKLLEADVYFKRQVISNRTGDGAKTTYGDVTDDYAYLKSELDWVYDKGTWFSPTYQWSQISTSTDFIKEAEAGTLYSQGLFFDVYHSIEFSSTEKSELESKAWVLRFVNTEYSERHHNNNNMSYTITESTIISDVSILRLKFETNGNVYDLPVISNKQTGSTTPVGTSQYDYEMTDFMKIIVIILTIILIIMLLKPIQALLKLIYLAIKFVFNLIAWIVTAPFRLIAWFLK